MSQAEKVREKPDIGSSRPTGKSRRVLPQIPTVSSSKAPQPSAQSLNKQDSTHSSVARGNDTTLDLTTVSDLSNLSWTPNSSRSVTILGVGQHDGTRPPKREFISPVKFVPEGEDSCVTVAVRVRPFSQREQNLRSKPVIRMHGNETIIKSQNGVVHRFYYDHCFWSIPEDSEQVGVVNGRGLTPKFATQESVYEELAQPLLERSFEGYNTCLFAYGQTGSGKSYCINGEGEAIGIVPRFAQELFDRIEGTADDETSFKVQVSFFEIYKERIHDLLASTQHSVKKKLRVREHPVLGPYVEDLSTFAANSYSDIERWIHLGNRFRATAATGMNDRSSRSHSVFTITLTQTEIFEGEEQSKVSRINLIDLAGSERSSVSKTSGERLKEGASINKSLHSLGKVISLLSDKGTGRRKKVFIPYRDSTLTWLLKESLGGNSKTAMIATISPSDLHYDESLSTLRYAQQARSIVNIARINEDPNAAIIRDLRQQIEALKSMVQLSGRGNEESGRGNEGGLQLKQLHEKLVESEKLMVETSRSWQEKLRASEARKQEEMEQLKQSGALTVNNRLPNLVNLTEDPQLSEMLLYVLKEGMTKIGRRGDAGSHDKETMSHDIELSGALVMSGHCCIENDCGTVSLHPSENTEAQTFLNGNIITSSVQLHHGDRIILGGEYFFRFNHPLEVEKGVIFKKGQGTFEYAKTELIRAQTARLEAELEEKRLREREQMMAELQVMKEAAQKDIDHQKEEYEERLAQLAREMTEQSMEVSHHQRFNEEAQQRMDELRMRNRALEEETMAQKHVIHLEKLKAEKEYEGLKEQKTRLMTDLEQERNKLVSDISHLNKNKALRVSTSSRRESTLSISSSSGNDSSLVRGSELVRLAMMLQEASAIGKSLNKPLNFSREELTSDGGGPEVQIRVNNIQLGLVTFWSLEKFESRLELMRDMYQTLPSAPVGSGTSLDGESVGSSEENDPFSDPTDSWVKEDLLTPHPSPLRSFHVRTLLSSNTSTKSATISSSTNSLPPRSLMDIFNSSLGSRGGSPILPFRQDTDAISRRPSYPQLNQSLSGLCYRQISGIMTVNTSTETSSYETILKHMLAMKESSQLLEEGFDKYSPSPDLTVPFSASPVACETSVSLYTSLELLLAVGRSLQRDLLQWEGFLAMFASSKVGETLPRVDGVLKKRTQEFIETICQQIALYCCKLLQGVDKEVEDMIHESCSNLHESLDSLTQQTGALSLARRVIDKLLSSKIHAMPNDCGEWLRGGAGEDDFLSLQPYQKSATLFYKGHCDWCTLTFELAYQRVQDRLESISHLTDLKPSTSDLVSGVCKVISEAGSFLQRLAEMQVDIWNLDSPTNGDGTLPLVPNITNVVNLLAHLQQIDKSVHTISDRAKELAEETDISLDKLSSSNGQVAYGCNELAACALTVIKNSPCNQTQEFTTEIQRLSHTIARAGKSVNHLIKKGGRSMTSKGKSSSDTQRRVETEPSDMPAVQTSTDSDKVDLSVPAEALSVVTGNMGCNEEELTDNTALSAALVNVESRTSMATGQLTQSPEHVGLSVVDHVTSKEDLISVADNDDEDSTLI